MKSTTEELVAKKLREMRRKSNYTRSTFRIDSLSLSLNLPLASIIESLNILQEQEIVTIHQPAKTIKNHQAFAGAVTLNERDEEKG